MDELFLSIIGKLREISADGKDEQDLRHMLQEYATKLEDLIPDTEVNPIEINDDVEAEFIQNYLRNQGAAIISTDDIKLVIDGQLEYLVSIGLAEPNTSDTSFNG